MYFVPRKISPETAAIYGILSILVSCFAGFLSVKDLVSLPSKPQHMTISDALSRIGEQPLWVILEDIQWDCEHAFYFERVKTSRTYIVFTDKNKVVLGLAVFGGTKDCQSNTQNEVSGVLEIAGVTNNSELYRLLTENGFNIGLYKKNGAFLSLCTYCGRGNSITGAVLSMIFFVIGILLFSPLIQARRARKSAQYYIKRNTLQR
jgi:hypothetical protein